MKAIASILLVFFAGCKPDNSDYMKFASSSLSPQLRTRIEENFNRENNGVVKSYDSCLFVNYLRYAEPYQEESFVKVLDSSIFISNYTCHYTHFSFSLIKNQEDEEVAYLGRYDTHYLITRSDLKDSCRLIPFPDNGLTEVVNKYFKPMDNKKVLRKKLYFFLHQLYFETGRDLNESLVHEILNKRHLAEYLSKEDFQKLDGFHDEDLFILNVPYSGIVILKWSVNDQKIAIEEFLIPFRRFHYVNGRLDMSPNFPHDCEVCCG